ncbi:BA14K family protein [Rhizobiaceae bacterium n13]|uniref:Lectin-like protein BA14k n=1 Tax=Ferirhizobium litorale TaxID=2927786 RepID=A0AAE3U2R3_9HYPH|nr:BA14K family protein [Fererhizobium litorale]MDI7861467.1 BA14K family protein [Fererhizobium litorale]MDI7921613.1 BA14K family protein [Fererhizobium litorale]
MKRFFVIALSLATAISGVAPAQAFPTAGTPRIESSDARLVQYRQPHHPKLRERQFERRPYWKHNRYTSNRYSNKWRGHSHDRNRYHRRYYRDDDNDIGLLFGGLAAGALIGGMLAQPRYYGAPAYAGNAHTSWCYSHYRSYRASDNTFQPYSGGRRQCNSPYD